MATAVLPGSNRPESCLPCRARCDHVLAIQHIHHSRGIRAGQLVDRAAIELASGNAHASLQPRVTGYCRHCKRPRRSPRAGTRRPVCVPSEDHLPAQGQRVRSQSRGRSVRGHGQRIAVVLVFKEQTIAGEPAKRKGERPGAKMTCPWAPVPWASGDRHPRRGCRSRSERRKLPTT